MICTDASRLQQVLINLQSNALKFTKRDGTVMITCLLDKDYADYGRIVIEVRDSGVGIAPENIGKLFKVFGFLE